MSTFHFSFFFCSGILSRFQPPFFTFRILYEKWRGLVCFGQQHERRIRWLAPKQTGAIKHRLAVLFNWTTGQTALPGEEKGKGIKGQSKHHLQNARGRKSRGRERVVIRILSPPCHYLSRLSKMLLLYWLLCPVGSSGLKPGRFVLRLPRREHSRYRSP